METTGQNLAFFEEIEKVAMGRSFTGRLLKKLPTKWGKKLGQKIRNIPAGQMREMRRKPWSATNRATTMTMKDMGMGRFGALSAAGYAGNLLPGGAIKAAANFPGTGTALAIGAHAKPFSRNLKKALSRKRKLGWSRKSGKVRKIGPKTKRYQPLSSNPKQGLSKGIRDSQVKADAVKRELRHPTTWLNDKKKYSPESLYGNIVSRA